MSSLATSTGELKCLARFPTAMIMRLSINGYVVDHHMDGIEAATSLPVAAVSKLPAASLTPIIMMIGCHPLVCPTTGWSGHEEEAHRSRASRPLNGPPGLLRDAHPKQVSLPSVSLGVVLSSDSKPFLLMLSS